MITFLEFCSENKIIYLICDFNIDLNKCGKSDNSQLFITQVFSHNSFSSIVKPSSLTKIMLIIIDHIWTNKLQAHEFSNVIYNGIYDKFLANHFFKKHDI